ncbi:(d)CMP kinase [Euzebya sp.]|uniref:(d)CMP kinase n=1 Tax=Euzebya sp. TaxID=1971409 RepID=UPI003515D03D
MPAPLVVAIDGPAGSGKSTVAQAVARALGLPHVDTGAYYRAATLAVLRAGVDPTDTEAVPTVVAQARIDRVAGRTDLDGEDVEAEIRGPAVTAHVSAVAAQAAVRTHLLAAQREGVARDGGVIEGRDAATAVAPWAQVKVWLDAEVEERARRRAAQAGEPDRVAHHVADLVRRDAADAAQMARSPDAVVVDTTHMSLEDVVASVVAQVRERRGR